MARLLKLLAFGACLSLHACFSPGDGIAPPEERIYFPVGLAMDERAEFLFVANSDFDLQFRAGVLQSIDLDRLSRVTPVPCSVDSQCGDETRCDNVPTEENSGVPSYFCVPTSGSFANQPCGALGEASEASRLIAPGRCNYIEPSAPASGTDSLFADAVKVGAFAKDLVYRQRPADASSGAPARLFMPVGGDATLHWIDVDDSGRFDCGQTRDNSCDARHRVGDEPTLESLAEQRLPTEPLGVAATEDGRALAITHQTGGQVSLFFNSWDGPPVLAHVEGGLPARPIGIAAVPGGVEQADALKSVGFLTTFRNSPSVTLLRVFEDGFFEGRRDRSPRPYLATVGSTEVTINDPGTDQRGLAVDDSRRRRAEAACENAEDRATCLEKAKSEPLDVYVASRAPASLLLGRTQPGDDAAASSFLPAFYSTVPLSQGPSRIVVGEVVMPDGSTEPRVFAICFDSRWIYVYDPIRKRIETQIETGRGPYAMVVDEKRGRGYVAHFSDSYIGVVSLDQREIMHYGRMIGTIGKPTPPRAAK